MAQHYNPNFIALASLSNIFAAWCRDGPFKAYGDVIALKTQEGPDGKLTLLAQIGSHPELVALIKAKQKIYTSVEINPDFADTKPRT